MVAGQVGGDAEEPGPRVEAPGVEVGAAVERDQEGLRGELVGELAIEATTQVAVDRSEVAFEDDAERTRVCERGGDRLAVDGLALISGTCTNSGNGSRRALRSEAPTGIEPV